MTSLEAGMLVQHASLGLGSVIAVDEKTGRYSRAPGAEAKSPRAKAKARRAGAAADAGARRGSEP